MKYVGFTVGASSSVDYGVNCVLSDPTPAASIAARDPAAIMNRNAAAASGTLSGLGSGLGHFGLSHSNLLLGGGGGIGGGQMSLNIRQQAALNPAFQGSMATSSSSLTPATLLAMQQQFLQRRQQQQQQQQFPGAGFLMSPALDRQGSLEILSEPEKEEEEAKEEEEEVIIEPVLRNRFLTKVARMIEWAEEGETEEDAEGEEEAEERLVEEEKVKVAQEEE